MGCVDLTIPQMRVRNAERQLARAEAAEDHYAIAAAKVALQQAQAHLAAYGPRKGTGD
jgi:hypothetical protein